MKDLNKTLIELKAMLSDAMITQIDLELKIKLVCKLNEALSIADVSHSTVDLSKCKKGDILISTHGAKLEYIAPTPWKHYTYLDHVVRYIEDAEGKSFGKENYGTRTSDGFTFAKNRKPETDHDIAKIL